MVEKLKSVPDLPGVYMFYDRDGRVIYVGKAKSLRKRLTSHLRATDPNSSSYRIVRSAADFNYIVVKNEREALITEARLIKEFLPKFNVLLKDDKSFPYLLITDERFPKVEIVRETDRTVEGEKFGPFIPAKNARLMKDFISRVFKLRKCRELKRRDVPCIQYHIERCTAPCCGLVDEETYRKQVEGALSFLRGNVKRQIEKLYIEIEEFSERLEFERAAILRDQLISLKNVYERNSLLFERFRNCNIYFLQDAGGGYLGTLLIVRNGIIYGRQSHYFEEEMERDVLGTIWISNTLERGKPDAILSNFNVLKDFGVKTEAIPDELIPIVKSNVKRDEVLRVELDSLASEFKAVFGFELPERIEVFDISTLQGYGTVGSCIACLNGRLDKSEYRRFKVRGVKGVDDYESMREVLTRRLKGGRDIPDLIVVDGGVGHLKVAMEVVERLKLRTRVFSIAKREEIVYTDLGEVVRIKEFPSIFRFITQLRDEAHRFAVQFNRDLRSKGMRSELFDGIKGLGRKRRSILEKFYPNPSDLVHVSVEELAKIGIPKPVAEKVISRVRDRYGG